MAGLRWGATSDTGRVRAVNQDSVLAELPLFAVADGMGGHAAGEVASQLALGIARQHLGPGSQPSLDALVDAVAMANRAVFEQARVRAELRGMGTTFCALALLRDGGERVVVANVGDSRGYVLRGDGLHQVTRDHSYVEDLVEAGEITPLEALSHPQRHIVTRALGVEPNVLVDTWERPALIGERYLLCSDGLTNELRDPEIEEVLRTQQDPQDAADRLVHLANERGSRDNVSVVVVDVVADGFTGRIEVPAPPVGMQVDELRAMAEAMLPGAALPPPAWTDAGASGVTTLVDDDEPPPAAAAAAAPDPPAGQAPAPQRAARRRRASGPTTARTIVRNVAFLAVLVGIVVFALLSVQAYGRAGWYVTTREGQITLFEGRADGLLWVKPKAVSRFPLTTSELSADWQTRLAGRIDFTSRQAAERWYQLLAANPDAVPRLAVTTTTTAPTTTTTTTTTTPGAPTTTPAIALPTTTPTEAPALRTLPTDEPSTIAP